MVYQPAKHYYMFKNENVKMVTIFQYNRICVGFRLVQDIDMTSDIAGHLFHAIRGTESTDPQKQKACGEL